MMTAETTRCPDLWAFAARAIALRTDLQVANKAI